MCGRWQAQPVCRACQQSWRIDLPRCLRCALPWPDAARAEACPACEARQPEFDRAITALDYLAPWSGLISRFKFQRASSLQGPFVRLMTEAIRQRPHQVDLILPVPLSAARLAERGYNQAWELVKALRGQSRRHPPAPPCDTLATALVRLGETPDQHSLGREARLRNLRGVFAAHPSHTHRLVGRHVLLVDDVTTTGATLQTAAQALLHAGADRVSALVFAHTPSSR